MSSFSETDNALHFVCFVTMHTAIQNVPGGKVNILGGHSIGHSKKKTLYEHMSYSERFLIFGMLYFEFGA
jgi:hypothetical protein